MCVCARLMDVGVYERRKMEMEIVLFICLSNNSFSDQTDARMCWNGDELDSLSPYKKRPEKK